MNTSASKWCVCKCKGMCMCVWPCMYGRVSVDTHASVWVCLSCICMSRPVCECLCGFSSILNYVYVCVCMFEYILSVDRPMGLHLIREMLV